MPKRAQVVWQVVKMFLLSERDSLSWSYYFRINFSEPKKSNGRNGLASVEKCS